MSRPSSASGTKPSALFLSPEAPYPAIGGGPLRSASLVEYLAREYAVHVVTFRQPGAPDPAPASPPGRICRMDVVNLPYHSKRVLSRVSRNLSRVARGKPPLVDRFSGFDRAIEALLRDRHYDLAIVEHFWCAGYLGLVRRHSRRVFLDLHNIESAWYRSLAAGKDVLQAAALRRFGRAAEAMERQLLPEYNGILVTSADDAELVRRLAPGADVTVYPNALPEVALPERREREEIAFSGNLEYQPNMEAVSYFQNQIWPLLRSRTGLKWKIIGKNPQAISRLVAGDPGIEVTGPVDDAVAELAAAQVAVVPVLSGSGTRVKILEAWAAATPVVSTSIGAQGLSEAGEHLVVADDPRAFASAISHLLDSASERRRIGLAGRRLYERRYTWPAAWACLGSIFETARLRPQSTG